MLTTVTAKRIPNRRYTFILFLLSKATYLLCYTRYTNCPYQYSKKLIEDTILWHLSWFVAILNFWELKRKRSPAVHCVPTNQPPLVCQYSSLIHGKHCFPLCCLWTRFQRLFSVKWCKCCRINLIDEIICSGFLQAMKQSLHNNNYWNNNRYCTLTWVKWISILYY